MHFKLIITNSNFLLTVASGEMFFLVYQYKNAAKKTYPIRGLINKSIRFQTRELTVEGRQQSHFHCAGETPSSAAQCGCLHY